MSEQPLEEETSPSRVDAVLERVLSRAGTAVADGGTQATKYDGDQLEREERAALRRVSGLSTELEDISEVEYRQLRLEKVVLVGLYSHGNGTDAEISLRELAALAETAGSEVLDGVIQRPDGRPEGRFPALLFVGSRDDDLAYLRRVLRRPPERSPIVQMAVMPRGAGLNKSEWLDLIRNAMQTGNTQDSLGVWDVLRAFEVLRADPMVDPARITVAGEGEGGILALYAALLGLHPLVIGGSECVQRPAIFLFPAD